ncbi:sensor domain-containing protein [Pseudonocardia acaciae]|uniref:sensor domain-containing protein n=1 Tax=Pseudonocardia acaciae TaxID=551276 RepID=UPI0006870ADB|nr:sensor domain-containing protein [Pseudonocardia acaciae]
MINTVAEAKSGSSSRSLFVQLVADSAYVLTAMPIALVGFTVLVTVGSVGVGTLVIVVGFPILLLALHVAQGFAILERSRIRLVTGEDVISPVYRPAGDGSLVTRMVRLFSDVRRWLDLFYGLIALVPGVVVFPIAVAWWSTAVAGVLYPVYDWAIPYGPGDHGLSDLLGLGGSPVARIAVNFVVGLVAAVTLPFAMRALSLGLSFFGRGLLTAAPTGRS